MARFVRFDRTNEVGPVLINIDHIISVKPYGESENSQIRMSGQGSIARDGSGGTPHTVVVIGTFDDVTQRIQDANR